MNARAADAGPSRLDYFVDAAFAFALTLLILTSDASAPRSMSEFVEALRHIPAFLVSFSLIAMFWYSHVTWSRHYGPRDGVSTFLSLALVFTVLVFVYPLRTMASSFMYYVSWGALPAEVLMRGVADLRIFVITYGVSYLTMSLLLAGLYANSLRPRAEGALAGERRSAARVHRNIWFIQAGAALLSLILAAIAEGSTIVAMWAYALLGVVLPAYGAWESAREKRVTNAKRVTPAASASPDGDATPALNP